MEVEEGLSVDQEGKLLSWMVEILLLWLSGQMAIQRCGIGSAYVSLDEIGRFGINLNIIAVENKDVYKPDLSTSCLTLAIGYISNKWSWDMMTALMRMPRSLALACLPTSRMKTSVEP